MCEGRRISGLMGEDVDLYLSNCERRSWDRIWDISRVKEASSSDILNEARRMKVVSKSVYGEDKYPGMNEDIDKFCHQTLLRE